MRGALPVAVLLLAIVAVTEPSAVGAPPKAEQVRQAERAFFDAFNGREWQKAIDAGRFWAHLDDNDYVPRYNLAVLLCNQASVEEAATHLAAAVERGFADRRRLDTDPGLRPLRETETYRRLVDDWPALLDAQLARRERAARTWQTGTYTTARDRDLRIAYSAAGALAPEAFGRARDELTRLAAWWSANVSAIGASGGGAGGEVGGDGAALLPWTLVILPSRTDYNRWAARRWPRPSGATSIVAGIYDHDERQLVAQDLGGTLRHEFCHALHWRGQEALGQVHPIWIQEGLCSLMEDVEVERGRNGDESVRPVPSWRTNSLKQLLAGGKPPSLARLFTLDQDAFVSSGPLANYALARAVFLYLFERGRLGAWYADYTRTFRDDATGRAALERALGKPVEQIERDFRAWVRALPQVATAGRPGGALLPGTYENGAGDGVLVKRAPQGRGGGVGGGAGGALAAGDVIIELAGQPVADLNDLTRVLGDFEPGARVDLRVRRGRGRGAATFNVTMTLVAR